MGKYSLAVHKNVVNGIYTEKVDGKVANDQLTITGIADTLNWDSLINALKNGACKITTVIYSPDNTEQFKNDLENFLKNFKGTMNREVSFDFSNLLDTGSLNLDIDGFFTSLRSALQLSDHEYKQKVKIKLPSLEQLFGKDKLEQAEEKLKAYSKLLEMVEFAGFEEKAKEILRGTQASYEEATQIRRDIDEDNKNKRIVDEIEKIRQAAKNGDSRAKSYLDEDWDVSNEQITTQDKMLAPNESKEKDKEKSRQVENLGSLDPKSTSTILFTQTSHAATNSDTRTTIKRSSSTSDIVTIPDQADIDKLDEQNKERRKVINSRAGSLISEIKTISESLYVNIKPENPPYGLRILFAVSCIIFGLLPLLSLFSSSVRNWLVNGESLDDTKTRQDSINASKELVKIFEPELSDNISVKDLKRKLSFKFVINHNSNLEFIKQDSITDLNKLEQLENLCRRYPDIFKDSSDIPLEAMVNSLKGQIEMLESNDSPPVRPSKTPTQPPKSPSIGD